MFMANDNTSKVTFEPSLDDNELTIDELGEACFPLILQRGKLAKKC